MDNVKLCHKGVERPKDGHTLKGADRANSNACRVLSDALREAGDERAAGMWRDVAEFLDVWAADLQKRWASGIVTYATDRRKFITLDYGFASANGGSGCYMIEKATGYVWSIKGYGVKNSIIYYSLPAYTDTYRSA